MSDDKITKAAVKYANNRRHAGNSLGRDGHREARLGFEAGAEWQAAQPAVPESDWTPCKQWLPAVGERYLCLGHAGKQFICWFDGNSWKREPQGKKVFGITHWMNLPEPPEDNTDD